MSVTARQRGWGAAEYLAVLAGLMAIWRGAPAVLAILQRSHADFAWALTIPY